MFKTATHGHLLLITKDLRTFGSTFGTVYPMEATESRLETRITLAKSVSLLKSEVKSTVEPMSNMMDELDD